MPLGLLGKQPSWQEVCDRMLQITDDLLLLGVYSIDTFDTLAFSVSLAPLQKEHEGEGPEISPDETDVKNMSLAISHSHLQGILNLIRSRTTSYVRLTISTMNFLCLGCGGKFMTGMSNFNMAATSLKKMDDFLYTLTKKHFTRSDSFRNIRALQMSALIHEDVLLIGVIQTCDVSSLSVLKTMIDIVQGNPSGLFQVGSQSGTDLFQNVKKSPFDEMAFGAPSNSDPPSSPEVQLRPRPKNGIDVRREESRRATSFCEDWRTATIKSIQNMQMVGQNKSEDQRPLISDFDNGCPESPSDTVTSAPLHPVAPPRKGSRATQV